MRKKEEGQGWGKGGGLRMGTSYGWENERRVKGGEKGDGFKGGKLGEG